MKLLRYGRVGAEKPGLLDSQGRIRDLRGVLKEIGPLQLARAELKKIGKLAFDHLPVVDDIQRLGTPYAGVSKFVAVGLNHSDHAAEAGTPPSVGMGCKPAPIYLASRDVVELGIEKLGKQRQSVVAHSPNRDVQGQLPKSMLGASVLL
jgi:2-keto-4-pentenoate hydratase/2-oxohepta-3-ene-1,7-dioic acid hydratase in catechol pathway